MNWTAWSLPAWLDDMTYMCEPVIQWSNDVLPCPSCPYNCAMGLSVPLNALAMRSQYNSTDTLILTEPETHSERDTKTVDSYINMHASGHRVPYKNKFKVQNICYITFVPCFDQCCRAEQCFLCIHLMENSWINNYGTVSQWYISTNYVQKIKNTWNSAKIYAFQFVLGSPDTWSCALELSTSSYNLELDPEVPWVTPRTVQGEISLCTFMVCIQQGHHHKWRAIAIQMEDMYTDFISVCTWFLVRSGTIITLCLWCIQSVIGTWRCWRFKNNR